LHCENVVETELWVRLFKIIIEMNLCGMGGGVTKNPFVYEQEFMSKNQAAELGTDRKGSIIQ